MSEKVQFALLSSHRRILKDKLNRSKNFKKICLLRSVFRVVIHSYSKLNDQCERTDIGTDVPKNDKFIYIKL